MQSGLHNHLHIEWLLDPDTNALSWHRSANTKNVRSPCPYSAELGQGWIDRLEISEGLEIYRSVHRFKQGARPRLLPLGAFMRETPETTLSVHTLHTGSAFSRELSALPDLALKPGQDLFRYATQGHAMPVLDTSTDVEMTALLVTQNTLQTFIGAQAARQLLRGLGLARTCKVRLASIPLHVTQPLRECLSSGSVGSLHTLFAQSKVLEYLWKLATYVESCKPPEHLEPRELETIRTLHDYLMHLEGDMPTLKMLAQKFGESPQCLNQSFLREYGQSIYTMVSGHRLAQAHKALTETGVPIKAIATRLGYSHVNHFSHAFKVKFGYTPGSLRRPS